jgi:head-tail adaptor
MAADDGIEIGQLRTPVLLARRLNLPDPDSTGILEPTVDGIRVWAKIVPIGPIVFFAGQQVGTPVTHRIFIRWVDWIDTTWVVLVDLRRPDGTIYRERYRIQHFVEVDGRRRFLRMECELEQRGDR